MMPETIPPLRQCVQKGHVKKAPSPERGCKIPLEKFDQLGGLRNHIGNLNTKLLTFASHAYYAKMSRGNAQTITYTDGDEVSLSQNEYIHTDEKIAEDDAALRMNISSRDKMYSDDGSRKRWFDSHYRKHNRARQKLEDTGLLSCKGRVDPTVKGLKGTKWTLNISTKELKTYPLTEPVPVDVSADYTDEELIEICSEEGFVDVFQLARLLYRQEHPEKFTKGEMCTSVKDRYRWHDQQNWEEAVAQTGADGPRHTTVGAFSEKVEKMGVYKDTPCRMRWVLLEFEDGSVEESHEDAVRTLETLEAMGADLSEIVVAFSGSSSWYVQIPEGMIGVSRWESSDTAQHVLVRWIEDYLGEAVDNNLLDPRHLKRLIGSRHEKTGDYMTGFTGREFLGLSIEEKILRARTFRSFDLPNPQEAPLCEEIHDTLLQAARDNKTFSIPPFHTVEPWAPGPYENPLQDAYDRIKHGVVKSEEWGTDLNMNYEGRDWAAFILACYLIKEGEPNVFARLEQWNQRNSPTLSHNQLTKCYRSAKNRSK